MSFVKMNLAHIGIIVRSIEASKKFYTEKLGFSIEHESVLTEAEGTIYLAFLSNGDCRIELIQLHGDEQKFGIIDHVSLRVENIEEAKQALEHNGIEFESEEITYAPSVFSKGSKWVFFRGPDGERLEINKIL